MKNPCIVGIAFRWNEIISFVINLPSVVCKQLFTTSPFLQIKWRIGHNIIHLLSWMLVVCKCRSWHISQFTFNSSHGHIHLGKAISFRLDFLTINSNILFLSSMRLNHIGCLNEHTSRAAARVIYSAIVWLYKLC